MSRRLSVLLLLSVACSTSAVDGTSGPVEPTATGSTADSGTAPVTVATVTTLPTIDDSRLPFDVYRHTLRPEDGYPAALLTEATLAIEEDCLLLRAGTDAWVPLWPLEVTIDIGESGPSASIQDRPIAGSEPAAIGGGEIALSFAEELAGRAISNSCPADKVWLVAEFLEP